MGKINNIKSYINKKYIFPFMIVLFAILLAVLPFLIDSGRKNQQSGASILSGSAQRKDITTTVSGTGTLADGESMDIELPQGVRLKEYLVNNGDTVKQGEPLAVVDKVSVMEAISSVQETLSYLEAEMNAVSSEYAESYLTSFVSGTVKKVYAQAGESVHDVMLEHGALALVSLDGLMALDIETDADLKAGDTVDIIFADGSSKPGTVKTVLNGIARITLPDEGYEPDECVEVRSSSGISLGMAELYINRAWRATAFTGDIAEIYISEGSTVYSGTTLFYLSNTAYTGDFELLAEQHREYEELHAELFRMHEDGYISSPADGMVWGISEDTVELLASEMESRPKLTFLSATVEITPDIGASPSPAPTAAPEPEESKYQYYLGIVTGDGSAIINPVPLTDVVDEATYSPKLDWSSMTKIIFFDSSFGLSVYDIALFVYDGSELIRIVKLEIQNVETPDKDIPGGNGTGAGMNMGSGAAAAEEKFDIFPLDGTVIMTVTPMDKVSVTFSVDELDILSLTKGQKAIVTIDALPGQSFEGLVTGINTIGENRKYSVEVSFDRTEKMLAGYNCSVLIAVGTKENVLSVPVEAQTEIGSHTYLYTQYDKQSDELTEPVEIQTGSSDGVNVEIISGMEEGDEFWYLYYDKAPVEFPF